MAVNAKVAKQNLIRVLEGAGNNVSEACKQVGVSRAVFYKWKNKDKKFCAAIDELIERVKDNVETSLYKEAIGGNVTAQIFFLKTRCRDRGYVEKQEIKVEGVTLPPWMEKESSNDNSKSES